MAVRPYRAACIKAVQPEVSASSTLRTGLNQHLQAGGTAALCGVPQGGLAPGVGLIDLGTGLEQRSEGGNVPEQCGQHEGGPALGVGLINLGAGPEKEFHYIRDAHLCRRDHQRGVCAHAMRRGVAFVAEVTQVDTGVCMQQQAHDLEVFVPDGKGERSPAIGADVVDFRRPIRAWSSPAFRITCCHGMHHRCPTILVTFGVHAGTPGQQCRRPMKGVPAFDGDNQRSLAIGIGLRGIGAGVHRHFDGGDGVAEPHSG